MSNIYSGGISQPIHEDRVPRQYFDRAGKPISSEKYWTQWEKDAQAERAVMAAVKGPKKTAVLTMCDYFCCGRKCKK